VTAPVVPDAGQDPAGALPCAQDCVIRRPRSSLSQADATRRDAVVAELAGQIVQRAMALAAGQYSPLSRWEAVRNLTCSAETLFAWVADEAPAAARAYLTGAGQ